MIVVPIKVLDTNYAYVVQKNNNCIVIDPGEAGPIHDYVDAHGLLIEAVLLTHKHHDHIGGAKALAVDCVYGGEHEDFPIAVMPAKNLVCLGERIDVYQLPGHTTGSVAYKIGNALWTGDVLFGAGCGRIFEGTNNDMVASLDKVLRLDPETKIYFGHEYTQDNLVFAAYIEPNNKMIQQRMQDNLTISTPTTLSLEKQTNPFLRLEHADVIERVDSLVQKKVGSRVERFHVLRTLKNQFGKSDDRR